MRRHTEETLRAVLPQGRQIPSRPRFAATIAKWLPQPTRPGGPLKKRWLATHGLQTAGAPRPHQNYAMSFDVCDNSRRCGSVFALPAKLKDLWKRIALEAATVAQAATCMTPLWDYGLLALQ
jgi:hypothetical protein